MSDTWIVQFSAPDDTYYDWSNADARVQRLLTPNEIKSFKQLCINHGAQLVYLEVGPGCGWQFKINTRQKSSLALHHAINEFVRNLNQ